MSDVSPVSDSPTIQREKKEEKKVEEGSPVILHCNPPKSSATPLIHWMDKSECLFTPECVWRVPRLTLSTDTHVCVHYNAVSCCSATGLRHIEQSERVTQGQDGNLYFSHVTFDDSRSDYTCNVQFLGARIIVVKEPINLKVTPCKWSLAACSQNGYRTFFSSFYNPGYEFLLCKLYQLLQSYLIFV